MQRALSFALLALFIVACRKATPEQQAPQPTPAPAPADPAPPPVADPAPTPDPSAGSPADPGSAAQTKPDQTKDPVAKEPAKDPGKTPAPIAKGEPNPGTPTKGPGPRPKGPGLHETCGTNDTCANGMKCMKYYGIAGPRGPEFKTCEVPCDKSTKCPSGTSCGTIADGPGQVCR